jgi:hypothetical protein
MKDKIPNINLPEGAGAKLVKAALVVGALFLGKKLLASAAKNSADKQLDTNPAAGQARALKAAMNPSGFDILRKFDGTDTDAIYNTAEQIANLDDVQKFYKSQTEGRDLMDDLQDEIGAEGINKFLALASKGKTGDKKFAKVREDIPAQRIIITTADANIRKTPKVQSKYLPFNNIVKLVPRGHVVGVTTGKFAYDEKDNVTFIEFFTFTRKSNFKDRVYFYVAKSQVELITLEEKKKREAKSGTYVTEILAGVNGDAAPMQTQLVSVRPAKIYDENFIEVVTAPYNIIVGFPVMTLNTKGDNYIKFLTVQGKLRWVKAKDVRTENRE